jgi:hypothetical protein
MAGGVSGYLVEELELMRWSVGERLGLLGRGATRLHSNQWGRKRRL